MRVSGRREPKVRFHQQSVMSVAPTVASLNRHWQVTAIQQLPCDWLVYEEMTRMERLAVVKCCTLVSPITVVIFAGCSKLPADALKAAESSQDGEGGGGFASVWGWGCLCGSVWGWGWL